MEKFIVKESCELIDTLTQETIVVNTDDIIRLDFYMYSNNQYWGRLRSINNDPVKGFGQVILDKENFQIIY